MDTLTRDPGAVQYSPSLSHDLRQPQAPASEDRTHCYEPVPQEALSMQTASGPTNKQNQTTADQQENGRVVSVEGTRAAHHESRPCQPSRSPAE